MAEDDRKVHIYRVIGRSPSGPVEGTYLDLLRSDVYTLVEGAGLEYKRTDVTLKWYLDDAGKVPNPSRKTKMVKLIPADEDPDNPQLWFEVDVNETITIRDDDQVINVHFDNSADNRGRKVVVRRVNHMDTTADDKFNEDGVIPLSLYKRDKESRDGEQHIDVEIIKKRAFRDADQLYAITYNNQMIIDALDDPDTSYGDGEINPPWRLDPLQVVVNIKTKTADQQWLLAIENDATGGTNLAHRASLLAADGARWTAYAGASGAGITVIGGAAAYGKATLSDGTVRNYFLACDTDMRTAKLGTVTAGGVSWRAVWSMPSGGDHPEDAFISSISYAKERFFITYLDENAMTHVVSTKDGSNFSAQSTPFPSRGSGQGPLGGGVAYLETDKKNKTGVYVMAGYELQEDDETERGLAFSAGFCWATSSNGVSWSGGKIDGVFVNPGGGGGYLGNLSLTSQSFIASGNGVLVAAASKRNVVNNEDDSPYILSSAAVAVSTTGKTWTTVSLPGAIFIQSNELGDVAGTITGVRFIEDTDYRDEHGNTGYFVACGYEGSAQGYENAKLWKSVDGRSWSLIRSDSHDVLSPAGGDYFGLSAIDKDIKTVVFV